MYLGVRLLAAWKPVVPPSRYRPGSAAGMRAHGAGWLECWPAGPGRDATGLEVAGHSCRAALPAPLWSIVSSSELCLLF